MDDREAFIALAPKLLRFAAVVAPMGTDPADLVQEALARTLRVTRLGDLDDPLPYLRRAVMNLANSQRRSLRRRSSIVAQLGTPDPGRADAYPSDLDDLRRLSPDVRAVLYLHLVERRTHEETAEILGISSEASRARLSRGLRRLRVELGTQEALP